VFQAYPFLESAERSLTSCRDFVRHTLPQIQSRSPQQLDGAAEAVLETEIDNEKTCVVGGDGVETASGMQEVKDKLAADDGERTESDSDDLSSQRAYPSWGRSRVWSPIHDDEDLDTTDDDDPPERAAPTSPSLPPGDEISFTRRLKSAFSVFLPKSVPTVRAKNHHRARSTQSLHTEYKHPLPSHLRLSTFSMSSVTSPPPSPSIRRSNASHPDITSLVHEWATSGPANQTLTFKSS
jgi:hypothetical protein